MSIVNQDSKDYWSGPSGVSWIDNEAAQDAILAAVNPVLLDYAGVATGMRVLDIGCGTGALTIDAARRVGASGHVIASDISEPLLDRAVERTRELGNVSAFLGDAQSADWPFAPVDLALSRFGVMFFNDPPAAFANIARALKPQGRMAFAAWGPYAENPWWQIAQRIASARLGRPPKVPPNSPGPMGLADMDFAVKQLRDAGLRDVEGSAVSVDLHHAEGARAVADLATRVGPARRIISLFDATSEDIDAIRQEMADAFAEYEGPDGLRIPARLNLFSAKPA